MKPRLHKINDTWMAVQIVPDVIELFGEEYLGPSISLEESDQIRFYHQCQVKWIDDQVVVPHGGLPREALEKIFRNTFVTTNCPTIIRD